MGLEQGFLHTGGAHGHIFRGVNLQFHAIETYLHDLRFPIRHTHFGRLAERTRYVDGDGRVSGLGSDVRQGSVSGLTVISRVV
jgi:hypothetical protein